MILCHNLNRRKNTTGTCDGNHVQLSDPEECCLDDAIEACTNQFGGCKDHYHAESEYHNHLNILGWQPWIFIYY